MRANCHKSDINLLEDLFIAKHFNLPHHSDKEHFEMIPIGKIPSLQMFPSHHFYWRINYYKNDILLWCEISASAFRQVTIDWQLSSLLYHKWKLPNVIGSLFFTNMPRKSTSHIFCSSLLMMNQSGFFCTEISATHGFNVVLYYADGFFYQTSNRDHPSMICHISISILESYLGCAVQL